MKISKVLDEKAQYSLEVQVMFCAKLAGLLYTCAEVLVLLENYIGNQRNRMQSENSI